MRKNVPSILLLVACAAPMALVLASCAPTYDSIADQVLVDTQKQADDGLLKLETLSARIEGLEKSSKPSDRKALVEAKRQGSYTSNTDFYNSLESSLTTLDTRMTAIPNLSTPKLSNALSALEHNVAEIRSTHASEDILKVDYLKQAKEILDQQFKALTVYELTIKSGSKPP